MYYKHMNPILLKQLFDKTFEEYVEKNECGDVRAFKSSRLVVLCRHPYSDSGDTDWFPLSFAEIVYDEDGAWGLNDPDECVSLTLPDYGYEWWIADLSDHVFPDIASYSSSLWETCEYLVNHQYYE